MDTEFEEVPPAEQPDTPETPSGAAGIGTSHTSYRDQIVDRTGELLATAMHVTEQHARTQVVGIDDPRDGTQARLALGIDGKVEAIPADLWDDYRLFPLFRTGTATLTQLPSFIAFVNRHKNESSAIFTNDSLTAPRLTAIFDYHDIEGQSPNNAANCEHRASYAFPLSEEWKAWFGTNAKPMDMPAFASFLETHIVDVSDDGIEAWNDQAKAFAKANRATSDGAIASPTRLVDLSLKFRIYETAESCEAVNLVTGETEFTFVSEHKGADGKPVSFPKLFSIVIPIFARSSVYYRLIARLRYRISNGKPVFWYELWRADLTFESAFNDAIEQVRDGTSLPVFFGSAEA